MPAAPETGNDHVLLRGHRAAGDLRQLQRLHHPFIRRDLHDDAVGIRNQQRRNQHRQHHRRQHHLDDERVDQLRVRRQIQQDKTEFTGLRQRQAGAHRDAGRRAEYSGQAGNHQEFKQHRHDQQSEHQRPVLQHHFHVQQHADRDEKQPEQHVAERLDVFFHLVLILGFGDQHAGDERAQRHRQAGMFGDPRRAQRHQQQVQHEQLLRLALDHDGEPFAHQLLTEEQQQHQHQCGFDGRPAQRGRQLFRALRQRRDHDDQRDHGQVLEQQDADAAPAVLAFQLEPFGEHLRDDGGRRHGQRAAQREGSLPADGPR